MRGVEHSLYDAVTHGSVIRRLFLHITTAAGIYSDVDQTRLCTIAAVWKTTPHLTDSLEEKENTPKQQKTLEAIGSNTFCFLLHEYKEEGDDGGKLRFFSRRKKKKKKKKVTLNH